MKLVYQMKITDQRPIKIGNSHYFTIPSKLISTGMIDTMEKYTVFIRKG